MSKHTLVRTIDELDVHEFVRASDTRTPPAPAPSVVGAIEPLRFRHTLDAGRRLRRNQIWADAAAVAAGFGASLAIVPTAPESAVLVMGLVAAGVIAGWVLALSLNKLYVARAVERRGEELRRLLTAGAGALAATVLAAYIAGATVPRSWSLAMYGLISGSLVIERWFARGVFRRLRAEGRLRRRVAIVGTDEHALSLLRSMAGSPSSGYEVVGLIGDASRVDASERTTVLGVLDDTGEILRAHDCVGALISLQSVGAHDVNRLTRTLTDDGFHVALSTSLRDIDLTRIRPQGIDGQNLIYVEPTIRTGWRQSAKRVFDMCVAVVGLLITAPFVAVAMVLIKLDSKGPVLFRQERVGREGEPFSMLKLRTMHADAEEHRAELLASNESDGPLFKIKRDPRITRVGRVLRKLSIDELPQFWNVVRGEMSVVGPRPALLHEVKEWDPELHERLRVLPGITGLWQVSGRAETDFAQYKRLDLYYVHNWSLLHDVAIVFRTLGAVVFGRGAS